MFYYVLRTASVGLIEKCRPLWFMCASTFINSLMDPNEVRIWGPPAHTKN